MSLNAHILNQLNRQDTARVMSRLTRMVAKHERDGDEIKELISYQGPRTTAKTGEINKEVCAPPFFCHPAPFFLCPSVFEPMAPQPTFPITIHPHRSHVLTFPTQIYTSGAINPQNGSLLAQLPDEILMRIGAYLPLGPTVALSLTCKILAAHSANARNHNQILYTNKEAAAKIAKGRPVISATVAKQAKGQPIKPKAPPFSKPQKLAMLILLTDWFPNTLSLCYRCLKFRPRGRSGWTPNREIVESGLATQKAIDHGPKCPACSEWVALGRAKDTAAYRKVLEGVKRCVK
jgi:hypothetical protein